MEGNNTVRARVFVSHAEEDHAFVLKTLLVPFSLHGIDAWVAKRDIAPGTRWSEQIDANLASCDWFLVVISRYALTSQWVKAEVAWALDDNVRFGKFIPLLIEECEWRSLHHKIRLIQYIDFREDNPEAQSRLLGTIYPSVHAPSNSPGNDNSSGQEGLTAPSCPYPGARPFYEADADIFFGREAIVELLLDDIRRRITFIPLLGRSGSGKSSIIQAGLIPRLRSDATLRIVHVLLTARPFEALATALLALTDATDPALPDVASVPELATLLKRDNGEWKKLLRGVTQNSHKSRVLVIVDQLDELYLPDTSPTDRAAFLEVLQEIASERSAGTLLLAGRTTLLFQNDFTTRFGRLLAKSHARIAGPLSSAELLSAIVEPASRRGVRLEDGLADRIASDVGNASGGLALLQIWLSQMWSNSLSHKPLTGWWMHSATRDGGRQFDDFIATYVNAISDSFTPHESEMTSSLMSCLIHVGYAINGAEDECVPLIEIPHQLFHRYGEQQVLSLINMLVEKRVLVLGHDIYFRQPLIEAAHKSAVTQFARICDAIENERDYRRWRQQLAEEEAGRVSSGVYASRQPSDLAYVSEWVNTYQESERVEREANIVWVVTRHFVWNLYHEFNKIVKANIADGKCYHFIYPLSIQYQVDQFRIENGIAVDSDQVRFTAVEDSHFRFVHHQIVIYDPDKPWPVSKGIVADVPNWRSSRTFDVKLNKEYLAAYIRDFREMVIANRDERQRP